VGIGSTEVRKAHIILPGLANTHAAALIAALETA
jgi:hypothetical protein